MKTLRCMAYQQDGVFVATCLDLSLAAQANTMQEAMDKLERQVDSFIEEVASEREFAKDLINRKAPLSMWVKYWLIGLRVLFKPKRQETIFSEPCKVA